MKKILILIALFMVAGVLFAEDVNIEKFKAFPERYVDKELTLKLWISEGIEKFEYEDRFYFISVYDNKQLYFHNYLSPGKISFVTPDYIAEAILDFYESKYATAERTILVRANLTGELTSFTKYGGTCWVFVVDKVEIMDRHDGVFAVLE